VAISTQVLDTRTGSPAGGVAVRLDVHLEAGWLELASAITDQEGWVQQLPAPSASGVVRLVFDTGAYLGGQTFYPEVTITFRVDDVGQYVHVPLLLSPYAYTTYRGS
jgi:5-hydroxyisourate hydrolase